MEPRNEYDELSLSALLNDAADDSIPVVMTPLPGAIDFELPLTTVPSETLVVNSSASNINATTCLNTAFNGCTSFTPSNNGAFSCTSSQSPSYSQPGATSTQVSSSSSYSQSSTTVSDHLHKNKKSEIYNQPISNSIVSSNCNGSSNNIISEINSFYGSQSYSDTSNSVTSSVSNQNNSASSMYSRSNSVAFNSDNCNNFETPSSYPYNDVTSNNGLQSSSESMPLSFLSQECSNCSILQKKLENAKHWKKFLHDKLANTDKLYQTLSDYEKDRQRYIELQLAYDRRTREWHQQQEQLVTLLQEEQPLRERLAAAESKCATLSDQLKESKMSNEALQCTIEQLGFRISMLTENNNPMTRDVREKKLARKVTELKRIRIELEQKNNLIYNLKNYIKDHKLFYDRQAKKSLWALRIALKLAKRLSQGGYDSAEAEVLSVEEHARLRTASDETHDHVLGQFKAFRKEKEAKLEAKSIELSWLPNFDQWIDDFDKEGLSIWDEPISDTEDSNVSNRLSNTLKNRRKSTDMEGDTSKSKTNSINRKREDSKDERSLNSSPISSASFERSKTSKQKSTSPRETNTTESTKHAKSVGSREQSSQEKKKRGPYNKKRAEENRRQGALIEQLLMDSPSRDHSNTTTNTPSKLHLSHSQSGDVSSLAKFEVDSRSKLGSSDEDDDFIEVNESSSEPIKLSSRVDKSSLLRSTSSALKSEFHSRTLENSSVSRKESSATVTAKSLFGDDSDSDDDSEHVINKGKSASSKSTLNTSDSAAPNTNEASSTKKDNAHPIGRTIHGIAKVSRVFDRNVVSCSSLSSRPHNSATRKPTARANQVIKLGKKTVEIPKEDIKQKANILKESLKEKQKLLSSSWKTTSHKSPPRKSSTGTLETSNYVKVCQPDCSSTMVNSDKDAPNLVSQGSSVFGSLSDSSDDEKVESPKNGEIRESPEYNADVLTNDNEKGKDKKTERLEVYSPKKRILLDELTMSSDSDSSSDNDGFEEEHNLQDDEEIRKTVNSPVFEKQRSNDTMETISSSKSEYISSAKEDSTMKPSQPRDATTSSKSDINCEGDINISLDSADNSTRQLDHNSVNEINHSGANVDTNLILSNENDNSSAMQENSLSNSPNDKESTKLPAEDLPIDKDEIGQEEKHFEEDVNLNRCPNVSALEIPELMSPLKQSPSDECNNMESNRVSRRTSRLRSESSSNLNMSLDSEVENNKIVSPPSTRYPIRKSTRCRVNNPTTKITPQSQKRTKSSNKPKANIEKSTNEDSDQLITEATVKSPSTTTDSNAEKLQTIFSELHSASTSEQQNFDDSFEQVMSSPAFKSFVPESIDFKSKLKTSRDSQSNLNLSISSNDDENPQLDSLPVNEDNENESNCKDKEEIALGMNKSDNNNVMLQSTTTPPKRRITRSNSMRNLASKKLSSDHNSPENIESSDIVKSDATSDSNGSTSSSVHSKRLRRGTKTVKDEDTVKTTGQSESMEQQSHKEKNISPKFQPPNENLSYTPSAKPIVSSVHKNTIYNSRHKKAGKVKVTVNVNGSIVDPTLRISRRRAPMNYIHKKPGNSSVLKGESVTEPIEDLNQISTNEGDGLQQISNVDDRSKPEGKYNGEARDVVDSSKSDVDDKTGNINSNTLYSNEIVPSSEIKQPVPESPVETKPNLADNKQDVSSRIPHDERTNEDAEIKDDCYENNLANNNIYVENIREKVDSTEKNSSDMSSIQKEALLNNEDVGKSEGSSEMLGNLKISDEISKQDLFGDDVSSSSDEDEEQIGRESKKEDNANLNTSCELPSAKTKVKSSILDDIIKINSRATKSESYVCSKKTTIKSTLTKAQLEELERRKLKNKSLQTHPDTVGKPFCASLPGGPRNLNSTLSTRCSAINQTSVKKPRSSEWQRKAALSRIRSMRAAAKKRSTHLNDAMVKEVKLKQQLCIGKTPSDDEYLSDESNIVMRRTPGKTGLVIESDSEAEDGGESAEKQLTNDDKVHSSTSEIEKPVSTPMSRRSAQRKRKLSTSEDVKPVKSQPKRNTSKLKPAKSAKDSSPARRDINSVISKLTKKTSPVKKSIILVNDIPIKQCSLLLKKISKHSIYSASNASSDRPATSVIDRPNKDYAPLEEDHESSGNLFTDSKNKLSPPQASENSDFDRNVSFTDNNLNVPSSKPDCISESKTNATSTFSGDNTDDDEEELVMNIPYDEVDESAEENQQEAEAFTIDTSASIAAQNLSKRKSYDEADQDHINKKQKSMHAENFVTNPILETVSSQSPSFAPANTFGFFGRDTLLSEKSTEESNTETTEKEELPCWALQMDCDNNETIPEDQETKHSANSFDVITLTHENFTPSQEQSLRDACKSYITEIEAIPSLKAGSKEFRFGMRNIFGILLKNISADKSLGIRAHLMPLCKAFIHHIICCNPVNDPTATSPGCFSLSAPLYSLFMLMKVLEKNLMAENLKEEGIENLLQDMLAQLCLLLVKASGAFQPSNISSKQPLLLSANSLACISAWYIASCINSTNKKSQLEKARCFLLEVLCGHPGIVHTALLASLFLGRFVFLRQGKHRTNTAMEKALLWIVYHGPFIGRSAIRDTLQTTLKSKYSCDAPSSEPLQVVHAMVESLFSSGTRGNKRANVGDTPQNSCSAVTGIVMLCCWMGRNWTVDELLPFKLQMLSAKKNVSAERQMSFVKEVAGAVITKLCFTKDQLCEFLEKLEDENVPMAPVSYKSAPKLRPDRAVLARLTSALCDVIRDKLHNTSVW